jgi:hypothetical protein
VHCRFKATPWLNCSRFVHSLVLDFRYAAYLGWQWRRTRELGEEIRAMRAAAPAAAADAPAPPNPALEAKETVRARSVRDSVSVVSPVSHIKGKWGRGKTVGCMAGVHPCHKIACSGCIVQRIWCDAGARFNSACTDKLC